MLASTLKLGARHIVRERAFSTIKIAGLALGIGLFILLIAFVLDERGYDRFHERADRIYMLTSSIGDRDLAGTSTPFLGELLKQEFPEVARTARFWRVGTHVQMPDGQILEQNVALADPSLFEVFTFPFKAGNPARVLDGPDRLVLSAAAAVRAFGPDDPLGKVLTLRLGSVNKDFTVSGVLREPPGPSSLRFDMLIAFPNYALFFGEEFPNSIVAAPFFHSTFLELREKAQASGLPAKFPAFLRKYYGQEYDQYKLDPNLIRLGLHKLTDYHLGSTGAADLEPRSRPVVSLTLFAIALAVLFLACFNHVNLSLGQASARTREIGIRKVSGALRGQLVVQFLADSLVMSAAASGLALALAGSFLPAFNALMGRSLSIDFLYRWPTLLLLPGLVATVAVLAGFWPAVVLSRLNPAEIFKGKLRLGGPNALTGALVVLQFALSVFLIVSTLVMGRQVRFMMGADIGFDRAGLIAVPTHASWQGENSGERTLAGFQDALRSHPAVLAVTGASGTVQGLGFGGGYVLEAEGQRVAVAARRVDHDFVRTLGLRLVQGRDFSRASATDVSEAVIVNEAFVRRFKLKDPVGKKYSDFSSDPRPPQFRYDPRIVGVVADYHFSSLRDEIAPLALDLSSEPIVHVLIRHAPGREAEALALSQEVWTRTNPRIPFSYVFLDDVLARQYGSERTWRSILTLATCLAAFIAAIGLFGLASLAASRRTKEIGIRKTMGGSVWDIVVLLSREFLLLVGVANLLAWPAAYIAARRWLGGFAFRTGISPAAFLFAAVLAVVAAGAALGYHAVRTALANPVDALRYE